MRDRIGLAALVAYGSTVVLSNLLITYVGPVQVAPLVAPGLLAPAGVYTAGLALALRDVVQERMGRRATLAAIVAGAAVSAVLSAQLALASGVAFLVAELVDMTIYTWLRRRSWLAAMVASNTVGLAVDSALFLWLAFGSLDFLAGQIVGKLTATLLAVALLRLARRQLAPAVEQVRA